MCYAFSYFSQPPRSEWLQYGCSYTLGGDIMRSITSYLEDGSSGAPMELNVSVLGKDVKDRHKTEEGFVRPVRSLIFFSS